MKSIDEIPKYGVRLEDMTLYFVFQAWNYGKVKKKDISAYWPADIDVAGMIRATRYPLGNPAKVHASKGGEDGNGKKVVQAGWYYRWRG